MRSGCVDVSSENGTSGNLTGAIASSADVVTVPNDILKHHILLFRISDTFKGNVNTRNSRLLRFTASPFAKDMVA